MKWFKHKNYIRDAFAQGAKEAAAGAHPHILSAREGQRLEQLANMMKKSEPLRKNKKGGLQ